MSTPKESEMVERELYIDGIRHAVTQRTHDVVEQLRKEFGFRTNWDDADRDGLRQAISLLVELDHRLVVRAPALVLSEEDKSALKYAIALVDQAGQSQAKHEHIVQCYEHGKRLRAIASRGKL